MTKRSIKKAAALLALLVLAAAALPAVGADIVASLARHLSTPAKPAGEAYVYGHYFKGETHGKGDPAGRRPSPEKILDLCAANGVSVHGHVIIYPAIHPAWVNAEKDGSVDLVLRPCLFAYLSL